MRKLILIILLMFFSLNLYSQQTYDKVFSKLKAKYESLETVSLSFTLNNNSAIKGNLTAKKGNKYILSFGNRRIYSDGETIWNYVPNNENVIISSVESQEGELSIEKIFFHFTNEFIANKLYNENNSAGNKATILELVPKNENNNDITSIKLVINPNSLDIYNVVLIQNYNEENWAISNLKLNAKIDDNKFTFSVPKNVEVIDLR